VFADDAHTPVEVTWLIYQQIITAYAHPDPTEGKTLLAHVIDTLRATVPAGLDELATLGRTLQRRRDDVLAYFTRPTEAINGRLEALRRNALGFRARRPRLRLDRGRPRFPRRYQRVARRVGALAAGAPPGPTRRGQDGAGAGVLPLRRPCHHSAA
jgi:hypothetical protein